MKLTKEELEKLLELALNKLKNTIVKQNLKKFIADDNLLNQYESKLNTYISSIDNIYASKTQSDLNLLANSLKDFLENTETTSKINIYKIKIIDSINLIINSVSKYERKGYEDRGYYHMGVKSPNLEKKDTSEKVKLPSQVKVESKSYYSPAEVESLVYNHILDTGYAKNNVHQSQRIYSSKYQPDISIDFENKTIAIIEIKSKNRSQYPHIDQSISMQIESYYNEILLNQDIIPRLFLVFYDDNIYTFYEYDIKTKKIFKQDFFPNYDSLVETIMIKTSKESDNIWDNFTKNININKLEKIKKGVNDENLEEGFRVRDFLTQLRSDLIKNIPLLNNYKAEQNQAPTQQYWTEDNGFRLSFYKGNSSQKETQINITVWASWGGGIFIKDNKKILSRHKDVLAKLSKRFNITYSEENLHIMIVSFKDNFPKYDKVIESVKDLINIYNEIENNLNDEHEIKISDNTFTNINNDNTIALENDGLSIGNDIDAIAKLIAYKELKPPLSIALFGKWGSGKSTFMGMLEERIEYLCKLEVGTFCHKVCHIKFNAWHYSDTNLWASLVSHIFKELDNHINGEKKKDRISIYVELLDSQKDKIEEKKAQKNKIAEEIKDLKESIATIENDKDDTNKKIKKVDLKDISKKVLEDENIKKEFTKIKEEFIFTHGNDISQIKKTYEDLNTTYSSYKKAIWLLLYNKKSRIPLFTTMVVFIILVVGSYFFTDELKSYISSLIAIIISGKVVLDTYLKKLSPVTNILEKFIKNYENQESLIKDDEKIMLEKVITNKNLEKKEINQQILIEKEKINEIEREIEKIESGEYLANFIADRSSSDDYTQHLGLVSVIREDFDNLKTHLKELENGAQYNIERIVLYIDDLDRCSQEKVIKVLEAIHLLLAFDLFVVVVGVDSRWVRNSLIKNYDLSENDEKKATPHDYLEKIFQIPFKVKPLTNDSKSDLVNELLKNDIDEGRNPSDNASNQEKDEGKNSSDNTSNRKKDESKNPSDNTSNGEKDEDENSFDNTSNGEKNEDENSFDNTSNGEKNEYKEIQLSPDEVNYINQLSKYIGDTPRAVKRFINIYRIIKNHNDIKQIMRNSKDDYKVILIILCFVFNDVDYLIEKEKTSLSLPKDIMYIYENYNKESRQIYIDFILRFSY